MENSDKLFMVVIAVVALVAIVALTTLVLTVSSQGSAQQPTVGYLADACSVDGVYECGEGGDLSSTKSAGGGRGTGDQFM